jgi:hypothetical protein
MLTGMCHHLQFKATASWQPCPLASIVLAPGRSKQSSLAISLALWPGIQCPARRTKPSRRPSALPFGRDSRSTPRIKAEQFGYSVLPIGPEFDVQPADQSRAVGYQPCPLAGIQGPARRSKPSSGCEPCPLAGSECPARRSKPSSGYQLCPLAESQGPALRSKQSSGPIQPCPLAGIQCPARKIKAAQLACSPALWPGFDVKPADQSRAVLAISHAQIKAEQLAISHAPFAWLQPAYQTRTVAFSRALRPRTMARSLDQSRTAGYPVHLGQNAILARRSQHIGWL